MTALSATNNGLLVSTANRVVFYLLACLVLLPSVTFGIVDAEVFPWALLFYLLYGRSLNRYLILVMFLLFFSGLSVVYKSNGSAADEVIRSFSAYINTLLVFNLIMNSEQSVIARWAKVVYLFLFSLTIIGLIQHTGILKSFDPLLKLFIPRGYTYSLSFMGDRGVTLLSSEPARAGVEYIFIYLVARFAFVRNRYKLACDVAVLVFVALIIKSAIALFFLLLVLIFLYQKKMLLMLFLSSPILLFASDLIKGSSSRAINLIFDMLNNDGYSSFVDIIINTGGHRVVSIYTSYLYSIIYPLGGGVGNWEKSSMQSIAVAGIDPSQVQYFIVHGGGGVVGFRSSGFVSNLAIDVGVVGLLLFFVYLFRTLSYYWSTNPSIRPIVLAFLVKIFFLGSVGNPVSWVCLAIIIKYEDNRRRQFR